MTRFRAVSFAAIVGVALVSALPAQESHELADKLAPVSQQLAEWQRLLAAQPSVSVVTFETGHVEHGFRHDDDPDFTATTKALYQGDRFLYDAVFLAAKGVINSRVENFDGVRYALLNRMGEGTWNVSSRPFLNDIIMCRRHFLFNPFLFLQSGFRKDALAQLSYHQLTDKDDWTLPFATLSADSTVEEITVADTTYLKVTRMGQHPDPVSDLPCVYDVYFAKDFHWYPMKWERRFAAGDGALATSYAVEELGYLKTTGGEEIPYPKVCVVKNYQEGKLRDTELCKVTQIDSDSVNDSDLTIDPNPARWMLDLDDPKAKFKLRK